MILSTIVTFAAAVAFANPPAAGHAEAKKVEEKTVTTKTETHTKVDCKDVKNKDKAECKKATH